VEADKDWWDYYPPGVVISERLYYWLMYLDDLDDYDPMGDWHGRNE
jgi:hypothetical protein